MDLEKLRHSTHFFFFFDEDAKLFEGHTIDRYINKTILLTFLWKHASH